MAHEDAEGPSTLLLTATVARRYYLDGASKSDIAAELDLSRFKVARLLDQARASGMVRIEVDFRAGFDLDLSMRLQGAYGLRHCVVVASDGEDDELLLTALGRAAADLLTEIVGVDDVLGLVWARSLLAMRSALERLAPCTVVQLTGALLRPGVDESSVELVRDVARLGGGDLPARRTVGGHQRAVGDAVDHEPADHADPADDDRRHRRRADVLGLRRVRHRRARLRLPADARAHRPQPRADRGQPARGPLPPGGLRAAARAGGAEARPTAA
jgi:hypothetical protein